MKASLAERPLGTHGSIDPKVVTTTQGDQRSRKRLADPRFASHIDLIDYCTLRL